MHAHTHALTSQNLSATM